MSETYRKESRKDWIAPDREIPDLAQLQLGCLQRIADATELMAKRHADLLSDNERLQRSLDYWKAECQRQERKVIAFRGQVTRLKNKGNA